MEKFRFYQDQKVRVWRRVFIEVEAEDKEAAIARVKELNLGREDVYAQSRHNDLEIIDTEMLYDTEELIRVCENDGFPTMELYDDVNGYTDKVICNNVD